MKSRALLLLACLPLFFATPALADDSDWQAAESKTALYTVTLPNNHKSLTTIFPVGKNLAVKSEQKYITIDQRPYQNASKSYTIKMEQTLGPKLSPQEIDDYIDRTLGLYEKTYKSKGAIVGEKTKTDLKGYKGGTIDFTYNDPTFGPQIIKAQIIYTDYAKYQLMVTGNQATMDSPYTRDFFNNLVINTAAQPPAISNQMKLQDIKSADGLFSVFAPENDKSYFPDKPATAKESGGNKINFIFHDPVRNEKLYFNIRSYSLGHPLSYKESQEILASQHIFPYRDSVKGIEFAKGFDANKRSILETAFKVNGTKDDANVKAAKLKGVFTDNKMVVAEILGSTTLVNSDFSDYLMKTVDFLPGITATVPSPAPATPAPQAPATGSASP